VKSEALLNPQPFKLRPDGEQPCMEEAFSAMHQQIQALEAQSAGLQALVCELLQKNQELRAELATARAPNQPVLTASAIHPRPRQDH
jgi:hypothetical protein